MSEKLTSKKIIELILPVLTSEEVKENILSSNSTAFMTADDFRHELELWEFPSTTTTEEFPLKVWNLWKNPKQWYRVSKMRLGREYSLGDFINIRDKRLLVAFCGDSNQFLLNKYCSKRPAAEKQCWHRQFHPKSMLEDNYCLDVITNPQDTDIVGWAVTVD